MSKAQEKKRNQLKQARLEIVAGMYKRGYSLRKIQSEVVKRLELSSLFSRHGSQRRADAS